ncbi:MAG: crossover junction endodeoxyribonuclease RuvC [Myxococcota bacterium]
MGVDPGSQATGYGVIDALGGDDLRWVAHGVLRPGKTVSLSLRLGSLATELGGLIETYRPDVACVENVFVSASARSALVLGQARGAALVALGQAAVPLVEYAPAKIKQSVSGSGRAPKAQVQRMVKRLLALQRTPPTDAADALAAAICHAQAGRLEALPRVKRRRPRTGAFAGRVRVRRAP